MRPTNVRGEIFEQCLSNQRLRSCATADEAEEFQNKASARIQNRHSLTRSTRVLYTNHQPHLYPDNSYIDLFIHIICLGHRYSLEVLTQGVRRCAQQAVTLAPPRHPHD